jgi:hypothetical protein
MACIRRQPTIKQPIFNFFDLVCFGESYVGGKFD